MPNHVTQQLSVVGVEVQRVIEHLDGSESAMDFNKVIPVPEELNIEHSSDGDMGLAAITGDCMRYLAFPWIENQGIRTAEDFTTYVERERPQAIELARKYVSNKQQFGHATWYEWCNANWGTKWNAYSIGEWERVTERANIRFDTAWSPAIPVIVKLSELFPLVGFELRYFDEGWNFAGEAIFKAGQHVDDCFQPAQADPRTQLLYRHVYGRDLEILDSEK